jgi:hypothetical protein
VTRFDLARFGGEPERLRAMPSKPAALFRLSHGSLQPVPRGKHLAGYVHRSAAGFDEGRINLPPFPFMLSFRELLCSANRQVMDLLCGSANLLMVTKKRTFVLEL